MNVVFFMQDTGAIFGAERATLDLASGLRDAGVSVRFFLMEETRLAVQSGALQRAMMDGGFSVERFAVSGRLSLKLARSLKGRFQACGGDVLHVIGYKANLHAKLSGIHPVVATVHGWLFRSDLKERIYDAIDRWCLRRCNRVICLSSYYRQYLLQSGIRPDRLKLIPSGLKSIPESHVVDKRRPGMSDALVFGMMGRFSEEKNHRLFLEAAARLHHEFPNCRFRMAGQGPLEAELKRITEDLGLSGVLVFCGYQAVEDFMPSIDVYVICSKIENLPYSILEAMAWARPVIGSKVGGIPDLLIDGVTGRLVDADQVVELADAMKEFAVDPVKCRNLGEAGRARVLHSFTQAKCVAMHQDVYQSLSAIK